MTPEQINQLLLAVDHADKQSDRWLFLAAIVFICGCGIIIIRYLVRQNEKQSERHGTLMEKVLNGLSESTMVIKEVRDWLGAHGAKLMMLCGAALVLGGCATLKTLKWNGSIGYSGEYGDYSIGTDGKSVTTAIRLKNPRETGFAK